MDKHQAQQKIRETFESSFDKNRFTGFIKNLLNKIEDAPFIYRGKYIPDAYKQYIKTLERVGKFSDGENRIDILIVTLQKDTSLERARTMQRNFIAWYLNGSRGGGMKDGALVAFVSPDAIDWRFSLVKMDYKFEKIETGRMKVKEEFTPARRWSFLVGANEKSHTAQSRLVKILANDEEAPTLEEIEKAFDIETVTKEFFLKYRELFLRTKEELDRVVKDDPKIKADFEDKGVDTVNFAKKLLGQIIFLYFLQKKGWFGVGRDDDWGTGSKHFLRQLFEKKHSDYKNFYNDILEPLFYEALRIDRSHVDGYYSRFNCKIPFLNGGLFDPIGNYDWVHTDIIIPDKLFSNTNKTNEDDTGDGILDIFDRYNFTVKEDEPLEKEVAIDPELLGKAYEKFNAIRPDNYDEFRKALKSGKKGDENKFNKKFGVYYTPREIVHYMCQQSLINYLHTELNDGIATYEQLGKEQAVMFKNEGNKGQFDLTIEHKSKPSIQKEDIETLIHIGEQVSEIEERIINKGRETETYSHKLPESIRNTAALIDQNLADITVCDPAVGSGAFPVGMMSEIVRARNVLTPFLSPQGQTQPTTVITSGAKQSQSPENRTPYEFKRRCIEHSLYGVDIDPGAVEIAKLRLWLSLVVDEDDIKNIKPLPNLDYKVVCGNSLLGVEKNLFNLNLFNELEKLKPLFFNETNPTKKQEFRKQINDLISQITNGHKEFDFEIYFSEVFHRKGGFDVVIANPPYFVYQGHHKEEIASIKKSPLYELCKGGKLNAYKLFLAKSSFLSKKRGLIILIFQNSFLADNAAKNIRKHYLKNHRILIIDSFPERDDYKKRVFEPVKMSVCILLAITEKNNDYKFILRVWESRKMLTNWTTVFSKSSIKRYDEKTWQIPYLKEYEKNLFDNLFNRECNHVKCYEGEINMTFHKYLLSTNKENPSAIKGAAVQRYFVTKNMSQGILEYLNEPLYLENNRGAKANHHNFDRVVMQGITGVDDKQRIIMAIIKNGSYCANSCNYIMPNEQYDIRFLLGFFNSKITNWMFKKTSTNSNVNCYEIEAIPIPNILKSQQKIIISFVEKILNLTNDKDYPGNSQNKAKVKNFEANIDQLVYKLYDLTPREIKIVEGENINFD